MKVKIETETAAKLFGCEIGDYRDLQTPDALALIEGGDVSAVEDDATPNPPAPKASPAKRGKK